MLSRIISAIDPKRISHEGVVRLRGRNHVNIVNPNSHPVCFYKQQENNFQKTNATTAP